MHKDKKVNTEVPVHVGEKEKAKGHAPAAHAAHGGGHGHARRSYPILNPGSIKNRQQKKFHLPIIGHFSDRSVEFKSIIDAERATSISYQMIFEACIGKIFKAKHVIFEYKKGNHYIKYKAFYINAAEKLRTGGHGGHAAHPTHDAGGEHHGHK